MSDTRLPTEVELVFEVMPCNAMRTAQEPAGKIHPCTYFRKWGTYHSYDYTVDGPPPGPGIVQQARYVGRAPLVPELLTGCRKAPIMAVGINPNLPGWSRARRGSLNPLFDDYKQYAHYFRYRAVAKLELPPRDYARFGGGAHDTPFSGFVLNVPLDADGVPTIRMRLQPQTMYLAYQSLLVSLADRMGWQSHQLTVGEDIAYGNMVACPSARWTTLPVPNDPSLPPMTEAERTGIVAECFHKRQHFLRQLFQSLPAVLLVFSQNTANALIGELGSRFTVGEPQAGESIRRLMQREIRMQYGALPDGTSLDARVIFAPHITGNPGEYAAVRQRVIEQLAEEAQAGRIRYNPTSGHLARPRGGCVFCTMLEIGPCDYTGELLPLTGAHTLTADSPAHELVAEKGAQKAFMDQFVMPGEPVREAWAASDDRRA